MRIEPKVQSAPVVVPVSPETREPKSGPAEKPAPASVVNLSEAGKASQADEAKVEDASARVASIRTAIRSGQYPIDLDKLAAKIIGDEVFRGVTR